MSIKFTLTGNRLSTDEWLRMVQILVQEGVLQLHHEPEFFEWGDGVSRLLIDGPGSIRGLTFKYRPKQVEVTFYALASRKDWRRGMVVLRAALQFGGGSLQEEDGTRYSAEDLTAELVVAKATEDFLFCVRTFRAQCAEHGSVRIQCGMCQIGLTVEDLPPTTAETIDATEAHLVARAKPYLEAFRASTFTLKTGAQVATWSLDSALVGSVTHVMVNDGHNSVVPYDALMAILGDRAEVMGNGGLTFLPGLDVTVAADAALIAAITAAADPAYVMDGGGAAGAAGAAEAAEAPKAKTEASAGAASGTPGAGDAWDTREEEAFDSLFADVMTAPNFIPTATNRLAMLGSTSVVQNSVAHVVLAVCLNTPPRDVAVTLRKTSLKSIYAITLTRLAMTALDLVANDRLEAEEMRRRLMQDGMTEDLATAVMQGVLHGLKTASRDKATPPSPEMIEVATLMMKRAWIRTLSYRWGRARSANTRGGAPATVTLQTSFDELICELLQAKILGTLDEPLLATLAAKHACKVEQVRWVGKVVSEWLAACQASEGTGGSRGQDHVLQTLKSKGLPEEAISPILATLAKLITWRGGE